jgi:hypothetical protein
MAFPFPQYAKIKDKYCIVYAGHHNEYIVQLLYLRTSIEQELPGIQIWICYKDCLDYLVVGHQRIIPYSLIQDKKREFAYIRQLKGSQIEHPIWQLLEESKLSLPTLICQEQKNKENKMCGIYPQGNLPVISLSNEHIENIKKMVISKGYYPKMNEKVELCGWVIGVENESLFLAGTMGIKTSLIPTGFGTNIYKKMFPQGEILKL